ncbi:hypothetical protein ACUNHX_17345 [Serratia sp. IR-2025]|nr:hypothetical protein [Serratia marcescens]MBN5347017.1 hypothetical protein [Serratia marcescens]
MTLTTERLKQLADPNMICKCGWDEYKSMATELLANREAQPVGYIAEVSGNRVGVLRGLPMPDVGSLIYTATPAPAVVKLPTEFYSDEGIVVRMEEVMAALAVVGVKYERKSDVCRAVMLAQPVSQRYTLPVYLRNYDGGCVVFGAADDAPEAPEAS